MAKLSFEEKDLSSCQLGDLNAFERDCLDDWIMKFKHYKQYPIVGKVSIPPSGLKLTRSNLSQFNGLGAIPENRLDCPIYVAVKGNIFDVSYGGKELYGSNGPYHFFAGMDASRALAKMSFEKVNLENSSLIDLTDSELKILDDWEKKFVTQRKYPIVGTLIS
jgi:membrane-associated progesterone receptor component